MKLQRPSAATVIATTALVIAVGGGSAYAATQLADNSVGTRQLQNGAVTHPKLATGSVWFDNIDSNARARLRGEQGPAGPRGATGAQGPRGPQGPAGSVTAPVRSLGGSSPWQNHSDGTDGNAAITKDGAVLGGNGDNGGLGNSNDYAGIATHTLDGKTPADLSTIKYTESYDMPADSHLAAPYFKLKLQPGDSTTCGDDDVIYNPSVQSTNLDYAGTTVTYDVTAQYSIVGAGDTSEDPNPVDGPYAAAIHTNAAKKDVSGEKICLAEIILGGGSAADHATATINNVTFAGAGVPEVTYSFGS